MSALNIGILGCGSIAQTMALTARKTAGFRAYAAASRNADKARGFAERNHVKRYYGSYEAMLQDRKVDLVYIATPHSEHFENAKLCISYGKPCLVEKAFTVNEAQARELFALADAKNVFITEAIWIRYMPFVRTIREVISSGVIGDPVLLSANLGYPVKSKPRLTDPALAGGSLLDLGIYPVNLASMLFGDELLRVEASCTYTTRHLDEQNNITLVYRDGRMASLSSTMLGATDRRGLISGTKGYVVIDNINNFEGMTVYDAQHRRIAGYRRPRQKTGYEYELRACRDALGEQRNECPEMTHAQTLLMLHIMDEIRAQLGIVYPCELPQPRREAETPATWQDLEHPAADAEENLSETDGPTGQQTQKAGEDETESAQDHRAPDPAARTETLPLPDETAEQEPLEMPLNDGEEEKPPEVAVTAATAEPTTELTTSEPDTDTDTEKETQTAAEPDAAIR